jgi:hypothetical protein
MATVGNPNGREPFACQSLEYSRFVFCLRLFLTTFNYCIYKFRIALLFLHSAATVALSHHQSSRSFGRTHIPSTSTIASSCHEPPSTHRQPYRLPSTFQSLPRNSIIAPPSHNISRQRHLNRPYDELSAQRTTAQQSQQQIESNKIKPSQQEWPVSATQLSGNASPSPYTWTRSSRARRDGEAHIMERKTRTFYVYFLFKVLD